MITRFLVLSLLIISTGLPAQNNKKAKVKVEIEKGDAENNTFKKGQTDLNIGLYLGRNYGYYGGGRSWHSASPLFSFSADHGITKNISIGAHLSYSTIKWEYRGTYNYYNNSVFGSYNYVDTYRWSFLLPGVRGAFHFAEYIPVENLDVYAGAMLGYLITTGKYTTDNSSNGRVVSYSSTYSRFAWTTYVGGRYRFTDKIGIYLELGYGYGYGNFGLNIKL